MKVAVIGANGQLGSDVVCAFVRNGDEVFPLTHSDIEITSQESVTNRFLELQPQVIVNTAAMHNVESCEREPERAYTVNAIGARNVALATRNAGGVLVHVSTDYVFDGVKLSPYVEHDVPCPLNVYGITKLAGEYFVRSTVNRHFVLRTSALYGKNPCRAKGGLNFVELMLKLAKERGELQVVDSEVVTPTSTAELAQQIVVLARSEKYGLYHATAEGSCSWYEFAREIVDVTNTKVSLKIAAPNQFTTKVRRPAYSVLENCGLKRHEISIFQPWRMGLRQYLGCPQ